LKISGFSFVRNGVKLYYPIVEAIRSILPVCDEFIVAVGAGDTDDTTRSDIEAIGDPKIRIIDTIWDEKFFHKGIINSLQTDIAMHECSGDWLFYLQADEVVHEEDLPKIVRRCEELLDNRKVEGLLFSYRHFWGDYDHCHRTHGWYPYEIRIVRNIPQIHSYQSAQSFRWFDYYDNPRQESGTRKLNVASVDARIFHYGWVRPPRLMQNKNRALNTLHWGRKRAEAVFSVISSEFDYGPMDRVAIYEGSHPAVMRERIASLDWQDKLHPSGKPDKRRQKHKHERTRVRLLSRIERYLNGGRQIGTFHNYNLLKKL
jgi:hypothetical protein